MTALCRKQEVFNCGVGTCVWQKIPACSVALKAISKAQELICIKKPNKLISFLQYIEYKEITLIVTSHAFFVHSFFWEAPKN